VKFGVYDPINLKNPDNEVFFSDLYEDADNIVFLFDYEWLYFKPYGKIGIKLGSGIYVATGNGRFENGTPADEKFTFIMAPNSISLTYYFQYWDTQTFIPYMEGGFDLFSFGEFRDDDKAPKFGGAAAFHVAGGLAINLAFIDRFAIIDLDREYGINDIYLAAEFRHIFSISKFDFTGDMITGGFIAEF